MSTDQEILSMPISNDMPRRTQAQILADEAQNFLHFVHSINLSNGGPIRTNRADRRQQRNAVRQRNYETYRARVRRRRIIGVENQVRYTATPN